MLQFLGLHLDAQSASVAILGRDMKISARSQAAMVNVVVDPATGVAEVLPAEWVRAGSYALQEAHFQLPVSSRKAWGLGLAGPLGWIALDVEYEPMTGVRITNAPPEEDLRNWLEANPRLRSRVCAFLSPKDYFRFAVSGGLAADVTTASRMDLLQSGKSQWSEAEVTKQGMSMSWLPPVFDCDVTTGRISEEGMRRTSLPGGSWLVAGAHENEARILAAADLRDGTLLASLVPGSSKVFVAFEISSLAPVVPPPGWKVVRSAVTHHQILERELEVSPDGVPLSESHPDIVRCRQELQGTGLEPRGFKLATGSAEVGAALLAAIGSGTAKNWDLYYKDSG